MQEHIQALRKFVNGRDIDVTELYEAVNEHLGPVLDELQRRINHDKATKKNNMIEAIVRRLLPYEHWDNPAVKDLFTTHGDNMHWKSEKLHAMSEAEVEVIFNLVIG